MGLYKVFTMNIKPYFYINKYLFYRKILNDSYMVMYLVRNKGIAIS
jgi:hypothetical protein